MSWYNKLGGRKTVMTLVLVALGTIVDLATQRGLSENLLTLLMVAGSGFLVGNVMEHGASAIKKRGQPDGRGRPAKVEVDLSPILERLEALEDSEQAQQAIEVLSEMKAQQEVTSKRIMAMQENMLSMSKVLAAATQGE